MTFVFDITTQDVIAYLGYRMNGTGTLCSTAIPRLVRVMRSKKMAFALTEFALIEVEYM